MVDLAHLRSMMSYDESKSSQGRRIVDQVAPPRFTDALSPRAAKVRGIFAGGDDDCHPFTLLYRAHKRFEGEMPCGCARRCGGPRTTGGACSSRTA